MDVEDKFVSNALIFGERTRARMLWNLLDGKAYTATELAAFADISRQSASNHLNKMLDAGFLIVHVQGRHRYYSFSNDNVAYAVEALANLIPEIEVNKFKKRKIEQKRIFFARTCYDHLAGKAAIRIKDAFVENEFITSQNGQFNMTEKGYEHVAGLGIDVEVLTAKRRPFIRACMDWTERKNHVAGSLGAELLKFMLNKDWMRKIKDSREVMITPKGFVNLEKYWGIKF